MFEGVVPLLGCSIAKASATAVYSNGSSLLRLRGCQRKAHKLCVHEGLRGASWTFVDAFQLLAIMLAFLSFLCERGGGGGGEEEGTEQGTIHLVPPRKNKA